MIEELGRGAQDTVGAPKSGCRVRRADLKEKQHAACSFPGENARSWGALGEARPGQSSLSVFKGRGQELEGPCQLHSRRTHGLEPEDAAWRSRNPSGYSIEDEL